MTILCGHGSDKKGLVAAVLVGARLAREGDLTFNIDFDSEAAFAGKPRSYRNRVVL
ncbi:hypothetical protein [Pseudomonas sp. RT6P73]